MKSSAFSSLLNTRYNKNSLDLLNDSILSINNTSFDINNFNKLSVNQLKKIISLKKKELNKINENKLEEKKKININIKKLQYIYNK